MVLAILVLIMTGGRALSFGAVTLLGVLAAAFGLWSGLTGPRVADVQVQQAAANLVASSSFVAVIDQTESVIGTAQQSRIHEVIDYVAPDRQMVTRTISEGRTSGNGTLTQIGASCWFHNLGSFPSSECDAAGIQLLLGQMRSFEKSSDVSESGGTYMLDAHESASWISEAGVDGAVGMPTVEARIDGEILSWVNVSFDLGMSGASILVNETVRFGDIDHGPPVGAPEGPPSETVAS